MHGQQVEPCQDFKGLSFNGALSETDRVETVRTALTRNQFPDCDLVLIKVGTSVGM
jgi:hypothetical protein